MTWGKTRDVSDKMVMMQAEEDLVDYVGDAIKKFRGYGSAPRTKQRSRTVYLAKRTTKVDQNKVRRQRKPTREAQWTKQVRQRREVQDKMTSTLYEGDISPLQDLLMIGRHYLGEKLCQVLLVHNVGLRKAYWTVGKTRGRARCGVTAS